MERQNDLTRTSAALAAGIEFFRVSANFRYLRGRTSLVKSNI
jgi:hypothetical protein